MTNDKDAGLTQEIIANHYRLDQFMKNYDSNRQGGGKGTEIQYPTE